MRFKILCLFVMFMLLLATSYATEKWHTTTGGDIYVSAAVVPSDDGEIVYIPSRDNKLYAISASTGTPQWVFQTNNPMNSSPVFDANGVIYIGCDDGYLYAIDPDGEKKWSVSLGGKIQTSPAIGLDNELYVGSTDGYLYCVSSEGSKKWSYNIGTGITCTPVLASNGQILVCAGSKVYAVKDQDTAWSYTAGNTITSCAIGFDGTIYFGSEDASLYALDRSGNSKWSYATGGAIRSTPAVDRIGASAGDRNGLIYFGSDDGYFYAIRDDVTTGTKKWRYNLKCKFSSSPAIASNGVVYIAGENGYLYGLNSTPEVVVSQKTSAAIYGSPVIGKDGKVYVGSTDGRLYAVAGSSKVAWPVVGGNIQHTGRMPARWTFMVYIAADNNLEEYGIGDVNEMECAGSTAYVNTVVVFDRIPDYDTTNGDWTDTRRGIILKDADGNIINSPLVSLGEKNMGLPATLSDFIRWSMRNYPAEHFALDLWNHGGGWRRANKFVNGGRDVCWDDTDGGKALTTKEIGEVIEEQPYIDLIACDACLMAMLECMYEWKKCGVYVASENYIAGEGWPYDTILKDLNANSTTSNAGLAKYIISRYSQYYGSTSTSDTLSAFYLGDKISVLGNKVNDLAAILMDTPADLDYAETARTACTYFPNDDSSSYFLDIRKFASNLYNSKASSATRSAASAVISALDAARISYYGSYYVDYGNHKGAYGVSIYFQPRGSTPDSKYTAENIIFAENNLWDEFLTYWKNNLKK